MSIEVRVPKEITEYKEKIIFGLSIRQLICFIIALLVGISTYFIANKYLGSDIASTIVMVEVMPIFAIGFIKKNGFTFEKYIALMIRHKLGVNKRGYKTNLLINDIVIKNVAADKKKDKQKRSVLNVTNFKIKKDKNGDKKRRECEVFEITKKSRKRKSKEAIREIKAAKQNYRAKKQGNKKTAKEGSSTENGSKDNQIQENV